MMKKIAKDNASRLINCGEVILISAAYKDRRNITTCAWHMPLSKEPPSLGVALAKQHFSSELIRESGEFIVNVPHWPLLDKVILCGSISGRKTDKFKKTGLTPKRGALLKTYAIKECLAHIECSLIDIRNIGDHYFFLGEVIYAEAEEDYFANGFWNTNSAELIFHLGAKYFFKSSSYIEFKTP